MDDEAKERQEDRQQDEDVHVEAHLERMAAEQKEYRKRRKKDTERLARTNSASPLPRYRCSSTEGTTIMRQMSDAKERREQANTMEAKENQVVS